MQSYLQKQAFCETLINEQPSNDLKGIVVIPSFNEEELMSSVYSLLDCNRTKGLVEILPILNSPESSDPSVVELHWRQYAEIQKLSGEYKSDSIRLHAIKPFILPDKIAGVGLARKIGMDEAVERFESISRDGIILNFDADCTCSQDYLTGVFDFFDDNTSKTEAVSIGFHHRSNQLNETQRQAIILYELHLKCYIGWQKFYRYPFAFQTLGSCFAVKSKAYQAQGGMNKRKAGEDFYFLHKFSILGKLGELNKILVFPSGRISQRVPFGTGKGVHDIIYSDKPFRTYNPKAIDTFCRFMSKVRNSYDDFKLSSSFQSWVSSNSLSEFLMKNSFDKALKLALLNSANAASFNKRISKWFDPFCLMKYLHYARDSEFKDVEVFESAQRLVQAYYPDKNKIQDTEESLLNELTTIAYR